VQYLLSNLYSGEWAKLDLEGCRMNVLVNFVPRCNIVVVSRKNEKGCEVYGHRSPLGNDTNELSG